MTNAVVVEIQPHSLKEILTGGIDISEFDPDSLEKFFGENFIPHQQKRERPFLNIAVELDWHIQNYVPTQFGKKWIGPISKFAHTPTVLEEEALKLYVAYNLGVLDKEIDDFKNLLFTQWFVKQAVEDFFEKGLHLRFVEVLKAA